MQVLQEFFVVVTQKVSRPLSAVTAAERIRESASWLVFSPTAADVLDAVALYQEARLSFSDAMIVHTAIESGCETLWSEDLADGRVIRGVRIRHPFAASA